MRIGFDGKRAFFNGTGLGNYSRSTVRILAEQRPENEYVLFSPKAGSRVGFVPPEGVSTLLPGPFGRLLPSVWRSYGMASAIRRSGVELYHGLSHELPCDIGRAGVRSVVTVHDLIFVRRPELYKPFDRAIYTRKYRRSCRQADRIIAISRQTRDDLIELWSIDPQKIDVVYQGCSPIFCRRVGEEQREAVRRKYDLPGEYLLSVGSIEARKNLMLTVQAMAERRLDIRLVAVGRRTPYSDSILRYAEEKGISDRIRFIHNAAFEDLPAIYQMSRLLVYVSFYEGFGIPILEAFSSGIPVITTRGGVFAETGGDAACYVDPCSVAEMGDALDRILSDEELRQGMIARGLVHAERFSEPRIASDLMRVYEKTLGR